MSSNQDQIASVQVLIKADAPTVWKTLTDPASIKAYMLGATVETNWEAGGDIKWSGEWKGKTYEDTGKILVSDKPRTLKYTHNSAGAEPHIVTVRLSDKNGSTLVTLVQDGNKDRQQKAASEANWTKILEGLKKMAEERQTSLF